MINIFCLPNYVCHDYAYLQGSEILSFQGYFVYFLGSLQNMLWVFVLRIEMLQIALAMWRLAFEIPTSSNQCHSLHAPCVCCCCGLPSWILHSHTNLPLIFPYIWGDAGFIFRAPRGSLYVSPDNPAVWSLTEGRTLNSLSSLRVFLALGCFANSNTLRVAIKTSAASFVSSYMD